MAGAPSMVTTTAAPEAWSDRLRMLALRNRRAIRDALIVIVQCGIHVGPGRIERARDSAVDVSDRLAAQLGGQHIDRCFDLVPTGRERLVQCRWCGRAHLHSRRKPA